MNVIVILILFIPGISYLVRKINSKHKDLSLERKLTNMLTISVGLWSIGSLISLLIWSEYHVHRMQNTAWA